MQEIKLQIQDGKDLLLLWFLMNNAQASGMHRLAIEQSKNDKIESKWFEETVDEWDRLMTLKVQIEEMIKNIQ